MTSQTSLLNLQALAESPLNQTPYPYLVINNIINEDFHNDLLSDLPEVKMEGSIPLSKVDLRGSFEKLICELQSDTFKSAIASKLDINLDHRPTMITYRARARKKDGRIHTDTKSKLVTVLLYLNPTWVHHAGRLRILNNGKDLDNYVTEIPPLLGRCLVFKVTDNCWHGHYPLIANRRSIQLNYVTDEDALQKHLKKHSLSARVKNWFS